MDFDSTDDEQAMRQQVADLVRAYLDAVPKDEKPLAVEVAAEAPLVDPITGEDLGMPLVGVIDLVLDSEAGPVITDFKTAARSSEPMEITNEIQLSSYAWLHRQITGQQEGGLEIRSLIKTKMPKVRVPSLPGPHGSPLPPALRRDPRVSRCPGRRHGSISGRASAAACAISAARTVPAGLDRTALRLVSES